MDVIKQEIDTLKVSGLSNSKVDIDEDIFFGRASSLKLPGCNPIECSEAVDWIPGTKGLLEIIINEVLGGFQCY